jgi:hypothetical protein
VSGRSYALYLEGSVGSDNRYKLALNSGAGWEVTDLGQVGAGVGPRPPWAPVGWGAQIMSLSRSAGERTLLFKSNSSAVCELPSQRDATTLSTAPFHCFDVAGLVPHGAGDPGSLAAIVLDEGDDTHALAFPDLSASGLGDCTFPKTSASAPSCVTRAAAGVAADEHFHSVVVRAGSPSRMYLDTLSPDLRSHLYVSTDGGASFAPITLPPALVTARVAAMASDPADAGTLYALALSQTLADPALFVTKDSGTTWSAVATPPPPAKGLWGSFNAVAIDVRARTLLLANGSRLFERSL